MAATLKHQAQQALSEYTFMDADHPLQAAWSDYQFAVATRECIPLAKARLRRELALEAAITRALAERRAA